MWAGQCTLWIVTKNSSDNRLYYGQLTVYQKNYNISYNGVAGETVQFAQSDFNDFMNKVAEARGDASKTKSYPYVTFDYVTFSLPTTAQGHAVLWRHRHVHQQFLRRVQPQYQGHQPR